jgi:hypothetical protein
MTGVRWLALSTVIVTACAGREDGDAGRNAQPIVSGTIDTRDPAVIALTDATGRVICTGTMISAHVAITAAHCGINAATFRNYRVVFGSVAREGLTVEISDARAHPGFVPDTFENDVALVTLRDRSVVPPVRPASKAEAALLVDAKLRVAGFGMTAAGANDTGIKRQGTVRVDRVEETSFHLAPDPSQPCVGDSGGPAFLTIGSVEVLAGVTSRGDSACTMGATDTRLDPYGDFINAYLAKSSPGKVLAGDRCLFPEHCAAGGCVVADDEPAITYCAPPCADDGACRAGMRCRAGECRWPAPTPGAIGAPCTADNQCVTSECSPPLRVCAPRCDPGAAACPANFECKNTAGIRFECVAKPPPVEQPDDEGGCSVSPRAPLGHLALGMLAMASLGYWSRRRAR